MKQSNGFYNAIMAVLLSGFGLVYAGHSNAVAAEKSSQSSKSVTTTKTLSGTISGITKLNLSLLYNTDAATGEEFEILFALDDSVKFIGRGHVKEFNEGDTILVTYDETVSRNAEDQEMIDRKVTTIKFLKAASVEAPIVEEEADPALISNQ